MSRSGPDIEYAFNGEIAIGYALGGSGPDLVYVPTWSNLEILWENPLQAVFLRSLASFARLVVMDRRGAGVSDRFSPHDPPPLEVQVDDLVAVLDAVGSERAVLFGISDTGMLCALAAAALPDRVAGLVLYATPARGTQTPDYPWQWSEEEWAAYISSTASAWGTRRWAQEWMPYYTPSLVGDQRQVDEFLRLQRVGSSPGAQLAELRVNRETDIRSVLPTIGVPTLVVHRTGDRIEPVGQSRFIAETIPGARYAELDGADHFPWAGDPASVVAEIRRFVEELRDEEEIEARRFLATVLFTDIVDSTAHAAALGDRRWRDVHDQHDRLVRSQIGRYRGREVKRIGDGFLAVFDGPARAIRCARAIGAGVAALGIEVRAGLHTGEIELDGDDVAGVAVAIGARVGALAGAGEVLVSSTVKDLVVGSGLRFDDRGEHELKGVPDRWHLYAAVGDG